MNQFNDFIEKFYLKILFQWVCTSSISRCLSFKSSIKFKDTAFNFYHGSQAPFLAGDFELQTSYVNL